MNGNIYINGNIGSFLDANGNTEQGVNLLDVILQVKNQPKAESFTVYIDSPGGYVDTGFEIYDYLKGLNKPITTIGQNMVASIATVIYMVGGTRILRPNTDFLIHLPSGGVQGNSQDIENYSKYIKDVEKRVVKFYNEATGLEDSAILPLLEKETILTTEQAFKLGFSTEKSIASPVVAYFNKPKTETMSKKEGGILSMIADILKGAGIKDDAPATNKIIFTDDQKELDFYELADGDVIEVGAKANYDGKAANGEYKAPSEEDPNVIITYVFVNGTLDDIQEPEAEVNEEDEMRKEIESLKEQLATSETAKVEVETAITALKLENKNYKNAIAQIQKLETEKAPATAKREKPSEEIKKPVNSFAAGINNLKNRNK